MIENLIFHKPEVFKYQLRALPNEIENGISTSLVFSAWNNINYVAQISDEKIKFAEKNSDSFKLLEVVDSPMLQESMGKDTRAPEPAVKEVPDLRPHHRRKLGSRRSFWTFLQDLFSNTSKKANRRRKSSGGRYKRPSRRRSDNKKYMKDSKRQQKNGATRNSRNPTPKDNRRNRRPYKASEISGRTGESKESTFNENPNYNKREEATDHLTDQLAGSTLWDSNDSAPQRSLENESDNREERLHTEVDNREANETDLKTSFDDAATPRLESSLQRMDSSEKEEE